MQLDMKELNPPTRFYFSEEPDSGSIKLRVMTPGKLAEVRDKTIKTNVEYKNNNRFEYNNIDFETRDRIIFDYCIVSWKGLIDDNGNEIECTTENKLKLVNEHPGFAAFVDACLDKLNVEQDKRLEYLEKN